MGLTRDYGYDFERFWKSYPKKGRVGKGDAYKAFQKLKLTTEDVTELVNHIEQRKRDDVKWLEGTYIPHAATFLRQHRWEDEYVRARHHGRADRPVGLQISDEDNARIFWQREHAAGRMVPEKYQHYLERH